MIRVLLADDHALFRQGLKSLLESEGMRVIGEAANGREAIRYAADTHPDVILMDIQMPDMDGLTATARLKADPGTSAIPVIAVTAHALPGDAERALAAGCVAHISKPVSRARLNEALDLALGGPGWRAAPGSP